jgi:hypothetical protein
MFRLKSVVGRQSSVVYGMWKNKTLALFGASELAVPPGFIHRIALRTLGAR